MAESLGQRLAAIVESLAHNPSQLSAFSDNELELAHKLSRFLMSQTFEECVYGYRFPFKRVELSYLNDDEDLDEELISSEEYCVLKVGMTAKQSISSRLYAQMHGCYHLLKPLLPPLSKSQANSIPVLNKDFVLEGRKEAYTDLCLLFSCAAGSQENAVRDSLGFCIGDSMSAAVGRESFNHTGSAVPVTEMVLVHKNTFDTLQNDFRSGKVIFDHLLYFTNFSRQTPRPFLLTLSIEDYDADDIEWEVIPPNKLWNVRRGKIGNSVVVVEIFCCGELAVDSSASTVALRGYATELGARVTDENDKKLGKVLLRQQIAHTEREKFGVNEW